ncbi:OLC1v1036049C1 [Oldenlandia corymbosa var. corymbosa]|uniref:OLC1v1036049C1 n=1 Tax=Oldenlandia corymbosa var. corymbosa TaxID=529605 RepID=A0AAV1CVJ2_OLDCO|nr:OLC1v1036049C1 [Oldenlandia corymbosa var. corymbosa]
MSPFLFHLLELNVISAQDLAHVSKNMRTYAISWINPERKLRTRIDQQGQINPTWNDKFVFRVDEKFLDSETSSVMIEIYAQGWFRDVIVGSVRVLISNLLPQHVRNRKNSNKRRFVALQIRRPSGRPQGILNMGVTLLDNNMKSMPLYTQLSASAVGFQDLMDVKIYDQYRQERRSNKDAAAANDDGNNNDEIFPKIRKNLRRSQSDCTNIKGKDEDEQLIRAQGSILNGSSVNDSIINGSDVGIGKNGSVCNSDVGPSPSIVAAAVARGLYPTPLMRPHYPGSSILGDWTADDSHTTEGLKSKIERWKMELPGNYDMNSAVGYPKYANNNKNRRKTSTRHHARRHSVDERGGMFSCFGTAYGCEFTIVCGADSGSNRRGRRRSRSQNKIFGDSELDSVVR